MPEVALGRPSSHLAVAYLIMVPQAAHRWGCSTFFQDDASQVTEMSPQPFFLFFKSRVAPLFNRL